MSTKLDTSDLGSGFISLLVTEEKQFCSFHINTMYNWVQRIYEEFSPNFPEDFEFPDKPGDVVILGIRDVAEAADGAREILFTDDEGHKIVPATAESLDEDRTTGGYSIAGSGNHPTDKTTPYNDYIVIVRQTHSVEVKRFECFSFLCTIDPGGRENDATGTPYLLEGKPYYVRPGVHDGAKAGHISSVPGEAKITLMREAADRWRKFSHIESALVREVKQDKKTIRNAWEFCAQENNDTVHMHHSYTRTPELGELVKTISTGCTALAYKSNSDEYKKFTKLIDDAKNKNAIPYLVVSSKYLIPFDRWKWKAANEQAPVVDKSKLAAFPQEFIPLPTNNNPYASGFLIVDDWPKIENIRETIRKLKGYYLPSIVDSSFIDQVFELCYELENLHEELPILNRLNTQATAEATKDGKKALAAAHLRSTYIPAAVKNCLDNRYVVTGDHAVKEFADALLAAVARVPFRLLSDS